MNSDHSSSATSQYHAQLYSGQKQLQKKHQQQQQQQQKKPIKHKPISIQHRMVSFEAPNLYNTSLKLTSEIEIHAWWESLVKIFSGNAFHATRVALSIPQDPSDPFNGPWGLKAVYNKTGSISRESDGSSLTHHESEVSGTEEDEPHYDYFLHGHDVHETGPHHVPWCFDRLQPFESEPEPLITNPSVNRILKRNAPVVLSREFRRRSSSRRQQSNEDRHELFKRALFDQTVDKRKSNWTLPIITTPCLKDEATEILVDGSCLSNDDNSSTADTHSIDNRDAPSAPSTFLQDFDEYEQQQPSPWSQSPAPSPAIMDPDINPFFQSPPDIDDEAFNPVSPESYEHTSVPYPPPLSNVQSVVHIPLFHPSDVIGQTQHLSSHTNYFNPPPPSHHLTQRNSHPTPIAILSFLAPIVPYPAVLLSSITSLSPFIAASFTNASQNSKTKKQSQFDHTSIDSFPSSSHYTSKPESTDSDEHGDIEDDHELDYFYHPDDATPKHHLDMKRPDHLGCMSNFTRSSLETVTDSQLTQEQPQERKNSANSDLSSSYASQFSNLPATEHENSKSAQTPQPQEKKHGRSSSLSSISYQALSPSSVAVIEGWGAVSPTTGLPISASIPPHNMCSNKYCHQHHPSLDSHDDEDETPSKTTEEEEEDIPKHAQLPKKSLFKTMMRKRTKRPRKYKRRGQVRKGMDDDGFHYHALGKTVDRLLVAPKSSLLRLIIDGIPIHVFTCSTNTGQVTWVNNRTLQYTGRPLKDHLGSLWLSHMHPDDQPECKKAWELSYEQGNGFAGEYRLKRFDGVYRCFLWRIVPLRDLKGRIIHWFGTCTDIHDQRVAKENNLRQMEIESNERKYRLLAEAIPQIVFTLSPQVGITYTNGKWSMYSGKSFDQTMGLGFMSCVHPEDRVKLQLPDILALKNKAGISWQTEVRLLSVNEEYRWFLVKCVSVDELDTGDIRWFGTCTDINDHKLLEQKLKEAHDAAQKSTESKTRFLSNMSHEIRTPLIGITGMLNFLLDTELTAEQMDYVHTIQQSAESLLVVINDILDLSKVEAGMMKLEWEPFSLITMIEDANELLSTLAIQKSLELSFWIDDDVPDVVIGDRVRLRQVLLNLIGNAIKFTTEGEVFTKCIVQKNDADASELILLFEVVDTGTGFDAADESVMFKPFSQVDSSSTRKHGGSGLGLVISRQLIELHGGQMSCKSRKGEGSTFFFTVKFGIPTSHTKPLPQTPQNENNNNPFFRSNGYNNYMLEDRSHKDMAFVNTTENNSTRMIPKTNNDPNASPADILQDVLMTKAAAMQLKPPPVRNSSPTAVAAAVAAAATGTPLSKSLLPSDETKDTNQVRKPMELRIPTIGSIPNALNHTTSSSGIVILPPRTPTRAAPLRALLISQWKYSLESMKNHIRSILKSIVHQECMPSEANAHHFDIDSLTNQIEATQRLSDPYTPPYDYIMINLSSEQQILSLTRTICGSMQQQKASVLVVTTPIQRSLITESAKGREDQVIPQTCSFVFKPLKQTKLRWYFGVRQQEPKSQSGHGAKGNQANSSVVSTPDTPYKRAATQKEIFRKMEADVGGKGYRILLVEDNLVNQKVLTRYLTRVGLSVDVATHGQECLDLYHKHPKDYYCLILCDLFMPVKDGYETTREIREWEKQNLGPNEKPKPIVALSANVMSNVANKCLECGFSTYISKPVNFAILSDVIRAYLLEK